MKLENLSRYSFIKQSWPLNLLIIIISAQVLAQTVSSLIAIKLYQIPDLKNQHETNQYSSQNHKVTKMFSYQAISKRNLLAGKIEDLSPHNQQVTDTENDDDTLTDIPPNDELEECTLPGTFVGIIYAEKPSWSVALHKASRRADTTIHSTNEGSNILTKDEETILVDIRPQEVIIKQSDAYELCELGIQYKKSHKKRHSLSRRSSHGNAVQAKTLQKTAKNTYSIERQEVQNLLSHLSQLSTKARFVPYFKGGKSQGFKIYSIRRNSLFKQLGLRNGDIITKINGYPITGPDQLLALYQKLKNSNSVSLALTRRGRSKTISVSIL